MFAGAISPVDNPTVVNSSGCISGWTMSDWGICLPVTTSAPSGLIETDPSKLPPSQRLTMGDYVMLGIIGVSIGLTAFLIFGGKR